jgi:hypothetical protein
MSVPKKIEIYMFSIRLKKLMQPKDNNNMFSDQTEIQTGQLTIRNKFIACMIQGSFEEGIDFLSIKNIVGKSPQIINYRLVYKGKGKNKTTFIEFSPTTSWVTENEDWYNNKELVAQMNLTISDNSKPVDEIPYHNAIWKKLGIKKKLSKKTRPYLYIGRHLEWLKIKWVKDMEITRLTRSVKQISYNNKVTGYFIRWCGFFSFDPRRWHSDQGYWDQYLINIDKTYIFAGNQEYYEYRQDDNNRDLTINSVVKESLNHLREYETYFDDDDSMIGDYDWDEDIAFDYDSEGIDDWGSSYDSDSDSESDSDSDSESESEGDDNN